MTAAVVENLENSTYLIGLDVTILMINRITLYLCQRKKNLVTL